MNSHIQIARRACEAAKARQCVVITFDYQGGFMVASYGVRKDDCASVAPLCDAIAEAIGSGELPDPTPRRAR